MLFTLLVAFTVAGVFLSWRVIISFGCNHHANQPKKGEGLSRRHAFILMTCLNSRDDCARGCTKLHFVDARSFFISVSFLSVLVVCVHDKQEKLASALAQVVPVSPTMSCIVPSGMDRYLSGTLLHYLLWQGSDAGLLCFCDVYAAEAGAETG